MAASPWPFIPFTNSTFTPKNAELLIVKIKLQLLFGVIVLCWVMGNATFFLNQHFDMNFCFMTVAATAKCGLLLLSKHLKQGAMFN